MIPLTGRNLVCALLILFSLVSPTVAPGAGAGKPPSVGSTGSSAGESSGSSSSSSSGSSEGEGLGSSSSGSGSSGSSGSSSSSSSGAGSSSGFSSSRSAGISSGQFTGGSVMPGTSSQSITAAVGTINTNGGNQSQVLLDKPAVQSTDEFKFNPHPGSNISDPAAFFRPLNSSYFACLATASDVLCLPSGSFNFGFSPTMQPRTRDFALQDVQYLIMPAGASVTLRGSSSTKKVKDSKPYTHNVTSTKDSSAFHNDIKSRVNTKDQQSGLQQGASFVVSVPIALDQPCVCAWTESTFFGDFYCFGPGAASIPQAMGSTYFNTQSLQFHGGAKLNGLYSGKNFTVGNNTVDVNRDIGVADGLITDFRVY